MGASTGISWTDATWNPVRGCSRVSEGCRHCYAELVAARFSGPGQAYEGLARRKLTIVNNEERDPGNRVEARWTGVVRMVPEHLADPIRWKRPRRIFVNSMSDLFHEKLTNEDIAAVFGVMAAAPQHTFQVLTKRAKRMREWFEWAGTLNLDHLRTFAQRALDPTFTKKYVDRGRTWPLPNVWLGVSVENQEAHDERAEDLLACPASTYFFSCEPLLGPIDASQSLRRMLRTHDGRLLRNDHPEAPSTDGAWRRPVDWVIVGCESGHGARKCDVAWIRSLRDQCATFGVPIFVKQAADRPAVRGVCTSSDPVTVGPGSKRKGGNVIELPYLDGVQHAAFPEVRHG